MPDPIDSSKPPVVRDKRLIPPGVLPKNMQAYVVCGIAAVMIAVIVFSGGNAPKARTPKETPAQAAIDPNAARIQEYQKRIEEQTKKLALEQAQLARSQEGVRAPSPEIQAAARPSPKTYRDEVVDRTPERSQPPSDKNHREDDSLYSSNIALTYRKGPSPASPAQAPQMSSLDDLAKLLPLYSALAAMPSQLPTQVAPQAVPSFAGTPPKTEAPSAPLEQPKLKEKSEPASGLDEKTYRLFEGTVLETVLTNRLDGSFSGPVNCMVTTSLYSHDGMHRLIPQGSRVLGEVRKVESFGQQRLAVFFHRVVMPDGYSVSLDQFQGLNQVGETGLRDQVNHHYLQVFGVSIAIGAIAGLGQANARTGLDQSGLDTYEQGVAASLSQTSLRILDRYLNVLPTFTIREGHRVKVYLSEDLLLPAYDKHRVPSDL